MPVHAVNKRIGFDYELLSRYEAGIVLYGHEVKSIKTGHVSLKGSFVTLKDGELYLINAQIPLYKQAGTISGYDPTRSRKLLLKKAEIRGLIGKIKTHSLTVVPIRVYTKRRLIKLEFALAKGKKKYDKRDSIKKRDSLRNIDRTLKNN